MNKRCRHGTLPGIVCLDCIGALVRVGWKILEEAERVPQLYRSSSASLSIESVRQLRQALTDENLKTIEPKPLPDGPQEVVEVVTSLCLEYHAGFLVCQSCGRADPLPLSIKEEGGFQIRLPDGYELRRYKLGATEVWAICSTCVKSEPFEAPTCIACGQPLSGHEPTCKTLTAPS